MTAPSQFLSFAQNGEDVVLDRALKNIERGFYVEVGANHPKYDSVSRTFYNRGWSGIAIEPNPQFAKVYRIERPRDAILEAAVTDSAETEITLHMFDGTGLSTLVDSVSSDHVSEGFHVQDVTVPTIRLDRAIAENCPEGTDIQFLLIDTEGAELQVLRSIDLTAIRPWILIVEATAPGSTTSTSAAWEDLVLAADYRFCLFDGLSRFYVAAEKEAEFGALLSYPACVFDDYITIREQEVVDKLEDALESLAEAEDELARITETRSWKITRPLRDIRLRLPHPNH